MTLRPPTSGAHATPRLHRLANGATLLCDPAPGFETLALSVVAGRGARWEDEGRSGWSHLLEHMVFKGAGERSARDIVDVIESEGGQLNAATGHERTSFQVRALGGGLPLALAVIADLLQRPTLDAGDLAREKQVVAQEIAEAADTPDDQVFERAQAAAFAGQPLGRPILGTPASLAPADPVALEGWRAALYAPDRLVISVAGAVDEDECLALAEAAFGAPAPAGAVPSAPARFTGGHAVERRRLEQAHLVFLLPAPGVGDPGYWPLRVFAEALGGGMSSRLFQEARERLGLAYAIDAYAESYADVGVLGVYAGCAPADAGRLAQVAAGEIRDLAATIGETELRRAKSQLKASLFMARESLLARAEQAAAQYLALGRLASPADMAAAIDAVDAEAIFALGERLTQGRLATVSVLGPKAAMDAPARFEAALFA
jgi:predicted Zn-dependent peptidase